MKQFLYEVSLLLVLCSFAVAQEPTQPAAKQIARQQITLQGSGIFTRKVTDSGLTYEQTSTAGILAGYRFGINKWLGVEGDYDGFRDSQKFVTTGTDTYLKANVNAVTGDAIVNIPNPLTKKMKGFIAIGGGALIFDPRDVSSVDRQTRSAIVFGGGDDFILTKRLSLRLQVRNFMYKAPDFGISSLKTTKWTQTQVPSAGLVYNF